MQIYSTVTAYVVSARNRLQDRIVPFRYTDDQVVDALNVALQETQRLRPDIFLDLKYQQRVNPGDLDDGFIQNLYTTADINTSGSVYGIYDPTQGTLVPISSAYNDPIIFYMASHLQLLDVEDTQDQRAVAFLAKFVARLTTATS